MNGKISGLPGEEFSSLNDLSFEFDSSGVNRLQVAADALESARRRVTACVTRMYIVDCKFEMPRTSETKEIGKYIGNGKKMEISACEECVMKI